MPIKHHAAEKIVDWTSFVAEPATDRDEDGSIEWARGLLLSVWVCRIFRTAAQIFMFGGRL